MTNNSKYDPLNSKYFYPGTRILKNTLNILNEDLLIEAEILFTAQRLLELSVQPVKGQFDFGHLRRIHRYIFQDIYGFAGEIRDEHISKGTT